MKIKYLLLALILLSIICENAVFADNTYFVKTIETKDTVFKESVNPLIPPFNKNWKIREPEKDFSFTILDSVFYHAKALWLTKTVYETRYSPIIIGDNMEVEKLASLPKKTVPANKIISLALFLIATCLLLIFKNWCFKKGYQYSEIKSILILFYYIALIAMFILEWTAFGLSFKGQGLILKINLIIFGIVLSIITKTFFVEFDAYVNDEGFYWTKIQNLIFYLGLLEIPILIGIITNSNLAMLASGTFSVATVIYLFLKKK